VPIRRQISCRVPYDQPVWALDIADEVIRRQGRMTLLAHADRSCKVPAAMHGCARLEIIFDRRLRTRGKATVGRRITGRVSNAGPSSSATRSASSCQNRTDGLSIAHLILRRRALLLVAPTLDGQTRRTRPSAPSLDHDLSLPVSNGLDNLIERTQRAAIRRLLDARRCDGRDYVAGRPRVHVISIAEEMAFSARRSPAKLWRSTGSLRHGVSVHRHRVNPGSCSIFWSSR
jgi:hypothetical protein